MKSYRRKCLVGCSSVAVKCRRFVPYPLLLQDKGSYGHDLMSMLMRFSQILKQLEYLHNIRCNIFPFEGTRIPLAQVLA